MADARQRLLTARQQKGWSQTDLANAAGVTVDSVRDHEHGRRKGPRTRKAMADALGVSLTDAEVFDA
jgi:ribosome-binding protein aMBF1 (putative translation factor)